MGLVDLLEIVKGILTQNNKLSKGWMNVAILRPYLCLPSNEKEFCIKIWENAQKKKEKKNYLEFFSLY